MVTKKPTAAGITKDTALEVSVSGDVIVLSPVREQGRADRIEAIANDVFARHTAAFKKLAE